MGNQTGPRWTTLLLYIGHLMTQFWYDDDVHHFHVDFDFDDLNQFDD